MWMAEGRQEVEWDLANSVACQIANSSSQICRTILAAAGVKPKQTKPADFTKMNPFRYE